jgi:hypothetical protein
LPEPGASPTLLGAVAQFGTLPANLCRLDGAADEDSPHVTALVASTAAAIVATARDFACRILPPATEEPVIRSAQASDRYQPRRSTV